MAEKPNVTRIKAQDSAKPAKAAKPAQAAKPTKVAKSAKVAKPAKTPRNTVLHKIGRYFKGAWRELREVRWPNRQATWSLTLAVILFSAFLTVLILALDALFKYLFQLIIA